MPTYDAYKTSKASISRTTSSHLLNFSVFYDTIRSFVNLFQKPYTLLLREFILISNLYRGLSDYTISSCSLISGLLE